MEFPKRSGIEPVKVHECADGGLLYEIYRKQGFGQLAIRTVLPGNTVGGHSHNDMEEWSPDFKYQ